MGWHYTRLLPNFLHRNPLILLKNNRKKALFCSLAYAMYVANSETVPYTNRRRLVLHPRFLVEENSDEYWIKLRKSGKFAGKAILPPSHPDDIRVQKIAKDIFEATRRELRKDRHKRAQTAHVEEFNLEVFVVDDPSNDNATCHAGGKIAVYTGMLRTAESDAEIAGVIGHEVGHVIARCGIEDIFGDMVKLILESYKSIVVCEILLKFLNLSRLSRSRRCEREADYIGLLLSASAGYDPQAATQRWKKDRKGTINDLKFKDYLYLTHPPDKERAKLLSHPKVMEEALSIYRKSLSQ